MSHIMTSQTLKNLIILFVIYNYFISSSTSSSSGFCDNDHDHDRQLYRDSSSYDEESGYDFEAYPSYFSPAIIEEEEEDDDDHEYKFLNMSMVDGSEYDIFGVKKSSEDMLEGSAKVVSVDSYGAKGDGKTDDTQAFGKAWKAACTSSTGAVFIVSKNKKYLLKPIRFTGPCKSALTIQIYGTIEASDDRSDYSKDLRHWLIFDSINNVVVGGGGIIEGNGNIWWQHSCKVNKSLPCKGAPTALTFYKSQNLIVKDLKIQNSQQMHLSFQKCTNVQVSNLQVIAPGKSPNTDGIHITSTQNIQLSNCIIATGDDCISIESGSETIRATGITCGPGHGISIGSLGDGKSEAYVSDVIVNGATLSGTTNGVRIKTWQGGSGSASNIKFQNIVMKNVANPIIIDQNYCDQDKPCKEQSAAVQVKNVVYQNIKGTSASEIAIKLDCSKSHPCQGIVLQDINIVEEGSKDAKAKCNNVKLSEKGNVYPHCP